MKICKKKIDILCVFRKHRELMNENVETGFMFASKVSFMSLVLVFPASGPLPGITSTEKNLNCQNWPKICVVGSSLKKVISQTLPVFFKTGFHAVQAQCRHLFERKPGFGIILCISTIFFLVPQFNSENGYMLVGLNQKG